MKFTVFLGYIFLFVVYLFQFNIYQVEAISNEIVSYPLGSLLGPIHDHRSFEGPPYRQEAGYAYRNNRRAELNARRLFLKKFTTSQDTSLSTVSLPEEYEKKPVRKEKKVKKRKKKSRFAKSRRDGSVGTTKRRGPVDITVHIKMDDKY